MYRILAADQRSESGAISASIPSTPSPSWWPRRRTDLVLGHHQAVGADQVDVLLPLRRARHLQPLRGRLDGRRPGELGAGRSSHRRDLPQTGRPAPGAHPALRPRRADDEQVHRTTARRPRRDPFTEPPSGVRRQPLLRGPVQDPEVPPRLPWPLPRHHRAIAFCRTFFPWYNTEHRHGGIAMLTPDDVHHNRTQSVLEQRGGGPFKPPGPVIPNASFEEIPQPDPLPQAVWINPPVTPTTGELLSKIAIVTVSKSLTGSAVPYPSPHRATPAYVVVTSSDLDTSRNKASVSGLSWISRNAFGEIMRSYLVSCHRTTSSAVDKPRSGLPSADGPCRHLLAHAPVRLVQTDNPNTPPERLTPSKVEETMRLILPVRTGTRDGTRATTGGGTTEHDRSVSSIQG